MRALTLFVLVLALAGPAYAQSAARQPDWARPLMTNDADALRTTGATLSPPSGGVSTRIVIAPTGGGVARLIRYDSDGKAGTLRVWRSTGHPRSGFTLWGGEAPLAITVSEGERAAFDQLARSAARAATLSPESSDTGKVCDGEYAFIESSDGTRYGAVERRCSWAGAFGALARALSDKAGSRDEEELMSSAIDELKSADARFSAQTQSQGLAAALLDHIGFDSRVSGPGMPTLLGADAIKRHFASKPAPRLRWSAEGADIAARGDLGVTWGRWADAGGAAQGDYLTTWRRDFDGVWKVTATMRAAD